MVAKVQYAEIVTQALVRRGRTVVRVFGRSMYPTLKNGMRVEVQPVEYDELRVGDIVVFNSGNGIICHRLLKKSNRLCHLKGDTNLHSDHPVIWAQVIGKVTRIVDDNWRIFQLDTLSFRRKGALLARFSYLYALYYNLLHFAGRCSWWSRGIEWVDSSIPEKMCMK